MPPVPCPGIHLNWNLWENIPMPRWLQIVIVLLAGLGAGLLYGWVISPIQYVDTTPDTLREDYRTDYVLMTAEAFKSQPDVTLAARELAILGSDPPAQITGRALAFARKNGYSEPDLVLLQKLDAAIQSWQGASGVSTP